MKSGVDDMNHSLLCEDCDSADLIGIQVDGVYDGVLIWECRICGHRSPRFKDGRQHDIALRLIEEWSQ